MSAGSSASQSSSSTAASSVESSPERLSPNSRVNRGALYPVQDPTCDWISTQLKASRGTELQGTYNPDILPILFRKQAHKWEGIARAHFIDVAEQVRKICFAVIEEQCKDFAVRTRIQATIREADEQCRRKGLTNLSNRILAMRTRHLQTNNPDFERKVAESRRFRFQSALYRYKYLRPTKVQLKDASEGQNFLIVDMRELDSFFDEVHMTNSRNLENEIHDILKAYYEIERTNFIENVNQLIVEAYLNDSEGPILQFSPICLSRSGNDEIAYLAAEDQATIKQREKQEARLKQLQQALEILKRYA